MNVREEDGAGGASAVFGGNDGEDEVVGVVEDGGLEEEGTIHVVLHILHEGAVLINLYIKVMKM